MASIKNIATGETITVAAEPLWVAGVWECGNQRFTDLDGALFAAVQTPPTVTPPQFKMLMLPELPEILDAANTDTIISAFMSVVNDPRLTEVVLALPSVQNGIRYCLTKIGRTADQISTRMAQILSGELT